MIDCTCPHCQRQVSFQDSQAGTVAECPQCQGQLQVPEQAESSSGQGLAALILGIASIFLPLLGLLTGLLAVIFGILGIKKQAGRGMAIAGIVLGGLALVGQLAMVSILLPALFNAREMAKQTVCGTNLKGLGTSMAMYAADNMDEYPALVNEDGSWAQRWDAPPARGRQDEFDTWRADNAGCNLQHYWLLVHLGMCGEKMFSCPSDEDYVKPEHSSGSALGFGSWRNSSFAFQPATRQDRNAAFPNRPGQDGAVIIAGDKLTDRDAAVGGDKAHRTDNHPGDGGNFLSMNASVSFERSPVHGFGWKENNVFTIDVDGNGELTHMPGEGGGAFPAGDEFPDHVNDSVLVHE